MTYAEVDRYVCFYLEEERSKFMELFGVFAIYNAESTLIGQAASQSKNANSLLSKYKHDVLNRNSDVERNDDENFNYLESQFKGQHFGQ